MQDTRNQGLFNPQQGLPQPDKTGEGEAAEGNIVAEPSASEGDSPNEGSVDGPLAPQPLPGGVDAEPESEMRPKEADARQSDGVAIFKAKESDAARHGRQAD